MLKKDKIHIYTHNKLKKKIKFIFMTITNSTSKNSCISYSVALDEAL